MVAARSGGGLACLACFRADADPALTKLATPSPAPPADVYLLFHRDSRSTPSDPGDGFGDHRGRASGPARMIPSECRDA